MTGRSKGDRQDTRRRCLATGESLPPEQLVRFVVGPGDAVVPDIARELPGRGLWVRADRETLERAVAKNLFARAARQRVTVNADLPALVERLLAQRALGTLGLARRAGHVVLGFDAVAAALDSGEIGVLIEASDAAADGKRKLAAKRGALARQTGRDVPLVAGFTNEELSLALGRANVVHAALKPGRLGLRFLEAARRLIGLRRSGAGTGEDVRTQ